MKKYEEQKVLTCNHCQKKITSIKCYVEPYDNKVICKDCFNKLDNGQVGEQDGYYFEEYELDDLQKNELIDFLNTELLFSKPKMTFKGKYNV